MDSERIKQIRDSKEKAAKRKLDNYQASGVEKYYTEYRHYNDLVEICDIALSISQIRDQNTKFMCILNEIYPEARKLNKNFEYESAVQFIGKVIRTCHLFGFRRD